MNNLEVIYYLFNKKLFNESKKNIDYFLGFLEKKGYKQDSIEVKLSNIIKDSLYQDLTDELFMTKLDLNEPDRKILRSKLDKSDDTKSKDLESFRNYFESSCLSYILHVASEIKDPIKSYKYIMDNEYAKVFSEKIDSITLKDILDQAGEDEEALLNKSGITSNIPTVNESYNIGELPAGQLITICGRPASGKSLFLMNEAHNIIKNCKKKVHYTALGDLNKEDFIQRLSCISLGIPFEDILLDHKNNYRKCAEIFKDNLEVSILPSKFITPDEYIIYAMSRIDDFDVFIIDYDSNFLTQNHGNLYLSGGEVYDTLTKLTNEKKTVYIASQPHKAYWNEESIPMEGVGESSRKQHISDVIITLGKKPGFSKKPCGILSVVKNRRGKECQVHYIVDENGGIRQIEESTYSTLSYNVG